MSRLLFILIVVWLPSCVGFKELPVEYDYSYKGNFKRYRTFDLMKYFGSSDTSAINAIIEKSIISRMKFLGYRRTITRPNLIVGYKLFPDSLNFHGYNQPDIEEWIKSKRIDVPYNKAKYNLKMGTLLIQLYDRKQNRSIWQGYATTEYGDIDFNNSRQIRNAVISILDKYRFWAEGFVDEEQSKANSELE